MARRQVFLATSALVLLAAGAAGAAEEQPTATGPGVTATGTAASAERAKAASAASGIVVEELVVTAREHSVDDLRSAPVAVTTFNAEQRNLVAANTIVDLVNLTPGVTISANGLNMRGVGRQTNETATLGSTPGIAYYVNGFYNLVAGNIGESTLYSETVQFQRGPQGTRYGRETIGGTASLFARHPTSEIRGEAVGQYGTNGFWGLGVNTAGPINDRYGIRVGYQHFDNDKSVQHNRGTAKEAGFLASNDYAEFQVEGRPTDQSHFWLRSTTFAYNSNPGYGAVAVYASTGPAMGSLVPNSQFGITTAPPRPRDIDVDTRGYDKLRNNMVHILNADYDLGPVKLYYVGGYAQYKAIGNRDHDNTSRAGYTVCNLPATATCPTGTVRTTAFPNGAFIATKQEENYLNNVHYFTHELRLENNDKSRLDWVVGGFYYNQKFDYFYEETTPDEPALARPTTNFAGTFAAPNPSRASYQQHNIFKPSSWAMFGDVVIHATPTLDVYGGLRFSDEKGHALTSVRYIFYNPSFGVSADVTPGMPFGLAGPSGADLSYHDKAWTGRLGLTQHLSDDMLVYAKYSRGFKPSAFRVDNVTSVATNLAGPETLDAFEVGWKAQVTPELSADVTAFYYKYDDMQIPLTVISATTNAPSSQYTNDDEARAYGIEAQATWAPISALWLNANYSYLNAESQGSTKAVDAFDRDPVTGVARLVPLAGRALPRSPEHKASLAGAYSWQFTPGSLILGGSVTYVSEQQQDAFENPVFRLPATTYTNASVTWRTADNRYDLILQASNLFDEDYVTDIVAAPLGGGGATTASNLGGPRFVQAQLRYRW